MSAAGNRAPLRFVSWLWTGRRAAAKIQVAVSSLVISLLIAGYYLQGVLRALTTRAHPQNVISVWDGFEWYTWLAAIPATLVLIRRYPLIQGRTARNAACLAGWSFVVYFAVSNVRFLLRMLPNLWLPDAQDLPWHWLTYLHTQLTLAPIDFLTFAGVFASSFAVNTYVRYRQRSDEAHRLELQATRLQSELAQARLTALRGQLQPHFLFNAFNAIATLVRQQKNDLAVEMIAQLSALLRIAMEDSTQPETTLERELEFVTHYLEVERIRFGDKLHVDLQVAPDTLAVPVPKLLLQPLAGNAIKHAISRRVSTGTVAIGAHRRGDRLEIEIADDGPGETPGPAPVVRTGVGLANTRARLQAAYHNDFRLEMVPRPKGGTVVRLDLPWRTAPAGAETPAAAP